MKKVAIFIVFIGVLGFGIGAAIGMHHAIKVQEKEGLGKYFTDTEGKTLQLGRRTERGV